jgi:hypothetical protein
MKQGRAIVLWAAMALAVAAITPAPASAEVAFTPPQTVSPGEASLSQVAVDPQGRATVVWQEIGPVENTWAIRTRRIDALGIPGPIHTLGIVPILLGAPQCPCTEVVVDSSGRATVTWQTIVGDDRRIESTQITPAGVPEPAQLLSPPGVEGWYAKPTAKPGGDVLVAWHSEFPNDQLEAVVLDSEGNPGEVQPVSEQGDGGNFANITVGPEEEFYATWSTDKGIQFSKLDEEGAPEDVQPVSPPGEDAGVPEIVVDPQGRATISWWRGAGVYEAKAVRIAADGTPGTTWTLSPPGQMALDPRIAVDPQGRVTAVWETFSEQVFSLRLDENGVPGEPRPLTPKGRIGGDPRVAAAKDGTVVVAWNHTPMAFAPEPECLDVELNPEDDVVRVAFIRPDGELDRIYEASPRGQQSFEVDLALDPLGLPWVTWTSLYGTYFCEDWDSRVVASHALALQPPVEEEPPPPPPPPTPPTPPTPPQEAGTLWLAKKGFAQKGRVLLRARCQGESGESCSGVLRLIVPGKDLRLAHGRYRVQPGQSKQLSVPLTKAAKRFLAANEPDRIATRARGRGLAATHVLIRFGGRQP